MTKEEMIKIAEKRGFANTNGEWCLASNPKDFKRFIENKGFEVVKCVETPYSTAIATTKDGYEFAYNGYCTKI